MSEACIADDRPRGGFGPVSLLMLALAVGGFAIGTGEFVIMGLLPDVAADLGITIPAAGHVISAYALGVVIGAPLIAVLAAQAEPPRRCCSALMALLRARQPRQRAGAGLRRRSRAARFLSGLPHGTYFGVAALVAASLAPPERAGRGGRPGDARPDGRDARSACRSPPGSARSSAGARCSCSSA